MEKICKILWQSEIPSKVIVFACAFFMNWHQQKFV
jgi:hypothetical protein